METLETNLHEAWASGSVQVHPGESLVFEGTVSGVDVSHIVLTFAATDEHEYQFESGKIKPPVIMSARQRAVENVEQALRDAGFSIKDVC